MLVVVVGTERGASGSGGNTLDCGGEGRAASLEGRRLAASQAPANLSRLVDINNRSTLRYLLLCSSPSTSQPNHREHISSSGHSSSSHPSFAPLAPRPPDAGRRPTISQKKPGVPNGGASLPNQHPRIYKYPTFSPSPAEYSGKHGPSAHHSNPCDTMPDWPPIQASPGLSISAIEVFFHAWEKCTRTICGFTQRL